MASSDPMVIYSVLALLVVVAFTVSPAQRQLRVMLAVGALAVALGAPIWVAPVCVLGAPVLRRICVWRARRQMLAEERQRAERALMQLTEQDDEDDALAMGLSALRDAAQARRHDERLAGYRQAYAVAMTALRRNAPDDD